MGKIRVKVLGDEEAEKKQQKDAQKRAEAKKAEKESEEPRHSGEGADASDSRIEPSDSGQAMPAGRQARMTDGLADTPETKEPEKKKQVKKVAKRDKVHSAKYLTKFELVDRNKSYKLPEAVKLLPQLTIAKFDETVELHINTTGSLSGNMVLPHGTGKQTRVVIINPSEDTAAADALVKDIESGKIEFDVLIATPDAMPRLARVARVLGPRGLMPNPKNGTVTPKPEETAKKFAGGQMNYKTEAKFPILHLVVGKVSFGDEKLSENIKTALRSVDTKNIRTVTLKSTMSPGIKLDYSSL